MDKWVWYCDACDEIGEPVEGKTLAVEGGKIHAKETGYPDECCVTVSPEGMHSQVALNHLLETGPVE